MLWFEIYVAQIKKIDTNAKITVATSKTQVSAIHNQLGEDVAISVEPCRRDTFPAIRCLPYFSPALFTHYITLL